MLATLLLAGLTLTAPAQAQVCSGVITLSSQAQVDAFNCASVTGSLLVSGDDITDLAGLSKLSSISNFLFVNENAALTSLAGLESLTSVGIGFEIRFNGALTSLAGLSGLNSVGGYLEINNNTALASLAGLENLTSVGVNLFVRFNGALTSLDGFSGLTFIGGNLRIFENPSLTSLVGLSELAFVGGALEIRNNPSLASLDGLENLTSVFSIQIGSNAALSECSCGMAGLISGDPPAFSGVVTFVSIGGGNDAGGTCNSAATVLATPCAVTAACPESLIVSDFSGPGDSVTLQNTGDAPASLDACALAATYTDVYLGLGLGSFDLTLDPGEAQEFAIDPDLRDGFGGIALLDRDAVEVGTPITGVLDDIVTSLVYLSGDVVYGFFHRNAAVFPAYCTTYPASRLHPFAQSQCAAPRGTGSPDGPVALNHAELTAAALAEVEGTASSEAALPTAFALGAAYPNPLSGRGTLAVELPEASDIRVVVYDVLGREVAMLADAPMEAGRHAVTLDGGRLATGTYVVRMTAGAFAQTQRITVVR